MTEFRRASAAAASVVMKRTLYPTASFIIVEGEDDKKFLRRFVDEDRCRIVIAHGGPNVRESVRILEAARVHGVFGVVDSDYAVLQGAYAAHPNLVRMDTHDLETMLFASSALEDILPEFGADEEKQDAFRKRFGLSVREMLVKLAEPVGLLRWLSYRDSLGLVFDGLDFGRFVSERDLGFGEDEFLRSIQERSRYGAFDKKSVLEKCAALKGGSPDAWHVCCGHDLSELLAIALRRVLAQNTPAAVRPERIESALRLAYRAESFARTNFYAAIQAWEAANPPYVVFRK